MRQLKPRTSKRICKFFWILLEPLRNLFVCRVNNECKVGCQHCWCVRLLLVVCVWNCCRSSTTLWSPLLCASRALEEFPLVHKEVIEVVVAPLCWLGCPDAFEATRDGVTSVASSHGVDPAKSLRFNWCSFWFWSYVLIRVTCTVSLSKGVTTSNKRDSFFVVHCHACKRFTNVNRSLKWVRVSVRSFWVYVDESHLHCTKWILEVALTGVALVVKPRVFRTPVDVIFWFPDVNTSTSETKCLKAH